MFKSSPEKEISNLLIISQPRSIAMIEPKHKSIWNSFTPLKLSQMRCFNYVTWVIKGHICTFTHSYWTLKVLYVKEPLSHSHSHPHTNVCRHWRQGGWSVLPKGTMTVCNHTLQTANPQPQQPESGSICTTWNCKCFFRTTIAVVKLQECVCFKGNISKKLSMFFCHRTCAKSFWG